MENFIRLLVLVLQNLASRSALRSDARRSSDGRRTKRIRPCQHGKRRSCSLDRLDGSIQAEAGDEDETAIAVVAGVGVGIVIGGEAERMRIYLLPRCYARS